MEFEVDCDQKFEESEEVGQEGPSQLPRLGQSFCLTQIIRVYHITRISPKI